jgi:hypothetical protein
MRTSFASRQPTVEQKMQGLAAAQESSANWFAAYGKRASILAQLKQIGPQFTYTGCHLPGSGVGVVLEPHEVPPLVDRSELPFEPRR